MAPEKPAETADACECPECAERLAKWRKLWTEFVNAKYDDDAPVYPEAKKLMPSMSELMLSDASLVRMPDGREKLRKAYGLALKAQLS
jgi:hypothetical protein